AVEVVEETDQDTSGGKAFIKQQAKALIKSIPLPLQDPSIPKASQKKRKAMALEHETFIVGIHCNKLVPEGVKFKENKVIEVPEYGEGTPHVIICYKRMYHIKKEAIDDEAVGQVTASRTAIIAINPNKKIIEQENELESDGDDDLPEVADPDSVAQEIRDKNCM
ncbi:hypothetical protein Tco_0512357, partial [Tanacetum coccineum]